VLKYSSIGSDALCSGVTKSSEQEETVRIERAQSAKNIFFISNLILEVDIYTECECSVLRIDTTVDTYLRAVA
jgi:hypothetical protein